MKNIETCYTVVGSSALKPSFHDTPAQKGIVIDFPLKKNMSPAKYVAVNCVSHDASVQNLHKHFIPTEAIHEFQKGSAQGKSFDRVTRLQAVCAGSLIASCAFATIFFGM